MWSNVELREIRTFLVLSEELHFGRAAERLELTPSRISQIVRTLETRVGGRLFDRTSRRVALTPLGEQLLRRVGPISVQLEGALREICETASGVAGTLRLGVCTPINGGSYLTSIVKIFESRHPGCRVLVTDTGFARDKLDWLRKDELDVLAMRVPIDDPDITIGPALSSEERVVALASVPMSDLPASRTALMWLTAKHSLKVEAFARAVADASATAVRECRCSPLRSVE
jgi:DNA-binding transcriptional LysR family regulator